jgi:hypothetical protein
LLFRHRDVSTSHFSAFHPFIAHWLSAPFSLLHSWRHDKGEQLQPLEHRFLFRAQLRFLQRSVAVSQK